MHLGFIPYFHSHAHDYSHSCKKPTPVRPPSPLPYKGRGNKRLPSQEQERGGGRGSSNASPIPKQPCNRYATASTPKPLSSPSSNSPNTWNSTQSAFSTGKNGITSFGCISKDWAVTS